MESALAKATEESTEMVVVKTAVKVKVTDRRRALQCVVREGCALSAVRRQQAAARAAQIVAASSLHRGREAFPPERRQLESDHCPGFGA